MKPRKCINGAEFRMLKSLKAQRVRRRLNPSRSFVISSCQLARKELSDWRHAKEEALSALKVLTEDPLEALRRVRKKTHKGEEDVEMDKDRMAAAIMEGEKNEREGEEEEEAGGANAKEEEPGPSRSEEVSSDAYGLLTLSFVWEVMWGNS